MEASMSVKNKQVRFLFFVVSSSTYDTLGCGQYCVRIVKAENEDSDSRGLFISYIIKLLITTSEYIILYSFLPPFD